MEELSQEESVVDEIIAKLYAAEEYCTSLKLILSGFKEVCNDHDEKDMQTAVHFSYMSEFFNEVSNLYKESVDKNDLRQFIYAGIANAIADLNNIIIEMHDNDKPFFPALDNWVEERVALVEPTYKKPLEMWKKILEEESGNA